MKASIQMPVMPLNWLRFFSLRITEEQGRAPWLALLGRLELRPLTS